MGKDIIRRRAQSIADGLTSGSIPGKVTSDYKQGFVSGYMAGCKDSTIKETRWQLFKRLIAAALPWRL